MVRYIIVSKNRNLVFRSYCTFKIIGWTIQMIEKMDLVRTHLGPPHTCAHVLYQHVVVLVELKRGKQKLKN